MMTPKRSFIPAARFRALTPYYDSALGLVGLGAALRRFERGLLEGLTPKVVLEVGCGTGDLLAVAAEQFRDARITGIDPDVEALAIARKKLEARGLEVALVQGSGQALAVEDRSVDLVLTSLMVHHLKTAQKKQFFAECRRVVAPGGQLLLVDFAQPRSRLARIATWPLRFNLFEETGDNFRGSLPAMLDDAGFSVSTAGRFRGLVAAYRAVPITVSPAAPDR